MVISVLSDISLRNQREALQVPLHFEAHVICFYTLAHSTSFIARPFCGTDGQIIRGEMEEQDPHNTYCALGIHHRLSC